MVLLLVYRIDLGSNRRSPTRFNSLISEIQHNIRRNHQQIEKIEDEDVVNVPRHNLPRNAENISRNDYHKEGKAFACGGTGFVRLVNINGPRAAKADKHKYLKHFSFLLFGFGFFLLFYIIAQFFIFSNI